MEGSPWRPFVPRGLRGLALGALLVLIAGELRAQSTMELPRTGDLLVTPTRIVLEGRARSAELTLLNTGTAAATYRITLGRMRMDEEGKIRPAEEPRPGERFADELLRYAPRQVRLEPGAPQTIRIQVRKPGDLEPGEYRAHLILRAVPEELATAGAGDFAGHEGGIRLRIIPVYGVSVPLIVRHGETSVAVALGPIAFETGASGERLATVTLHRTGNRSVLGDLTVTLVGPDGDRRTLTRMRKLAVYDPNSVRRLTIALPPIEVGRYAGLEVVFAPLDGAGDPALVFAPL